MVTPRFLAEDEGVTVADPRVIERSWEMEGLAWMMRSCFGEVQLEVVLGHPGRDVCEAGLFTPIVRLLVPNQWMNCYFVAFFIRSG